MNHLCEQGCVVISRPLGRDLLSLLLFALLVRLVTFNGAFGSDDLTYYQSAVGLGHGEWVAANYNGALRYGFNLPAAAMVAIFGDSLFAVNLWPLMCSLIEVAAVYVFANAAFNRRTALIAALLLATVPLHIAVATRIHADPVVSMFLTLGFVLLYFGITRNKPHILFAAGLAIGGVFWAKELAAVTWFAFLPLLWLFRQQWRSSLYVVAGTILMLILHGVLMYSLAGDPLHLVKVVVSAMKKGYIDAPESKDATAWYYLRYLLFDIRHTGLLGLLAVVSLLLYLFSKELHARFGNGFIFVLLWFVALLAVLSVFPVSLTPLRFPMKQSNYISLFLAPMALLAAIPLSRLPRVALGSALTTCAGLGLLLGIFQQADYRVFTANTKALATFAVEHPNALIIGSANNSGLGSLWGRLEYPDLEKAAIIDYRDLGQPSDLTKQRLDDAEKIFTVLDHQTIAWFSSPKTVTRPLDCWTYVQTVEPTGFGLGNQVAKLILEVFGGNSSIAGTLGRLVHPLKADIYIVDGDDVLCRGN